MGMAYFRLSLVASAVAFGCAWGLHAPQPRRLRGTGLLQRTQLSALEAKKGEACSRREATEALALLLGTAALAASPAPSYALDWLCQTTGYCDWRVKFAVSKLGKPAECICKRYRGFFGHAKLESSLERDCLEEKYEASVKSTSPKPAACDRDDCGACRKDVQCGTVVLPPLEI
eukprot:scaffold4077_cov257-Pinguiococcus_pyrenoidosus.AAC.6